MPNGEAASESAVTPGVRGLRRLRSKIVLALVGAALLAALIWALTRA